MKILHSLLLAPAFAAVFTALIWPASSQDVVMPEELLGNYGPGFEDRCSLVVMQVTSAGFRSDEAVCTLSGITKDPEEGVFRAFQCDNHMLPEMYELGAVWTLDSKGQLSIERGGYAEFYTKCR